MQYVASGLEAIVASRREDAYRQMFEACGGSYNIAREFDEQGPSYTSGNTQYNRNSAYSSAVTTTSTIRVIEFVCVPANAPAPVPVQ